MIIRRGWNENGIPIMISKNMANIMLRYIAEVTI